MAQPVFLTASELDAISHLARRLRSARLRRNISQAAMAERAGVTRKTYVDVEAGKPTVSFSTIVKVIGILGYLERIPGLLESDPLGEDIGAETGRRHAGGAHVVADF